jgi:hypothetical protein
MEVRDAYWSRQDSAATASPALRKIYLIHILSYEWKTLQMRWHHKIRRIILKETFQYVECLQQSHPVVERDNIIPFERRKDIARAELLEGICGPGSQLDRQSDMVYAT